MRYFNVQIFARSRLYRRVDRKFKFQVIKICCGSSLYDSPPLENTQNLAWETSAYRSKYRLRNDTFSRKISDTLCTFKCVQTRFSQKSRCVFAWECGILVLIEPRLGSTALRRTGQARGRWKREYNKMKGESSWQWGLDDKNNS